MLFNGNVLIHTFYVISLIACASTSSMMIYWLILEINIVSFIMILALSCNEEGFNSNQILYYFLVQTIGSLFFIIWVPLNENEILPGLDICIIVAVALKTGLAPFQSWVLNISNNMSSNSLSILLSIQNIPMFLLLFSLETEVSTPLMISSIVIGSVIIYLSSQLNELLVYSSVYITLWIYLIYVNINEIFFPYIMFYLALNNIIISESQNGESSSSNIFSYLMFAAGLPPFMLFIVNVVTMANVSDDYSPLLIFALWIFSFLAVISYFMYFMNTLNPLKESYFNSSHPNTSVENAVYLIGGSLLAMGFYVS